MIIKPDNNYWSDSYDTDRWDMAQEAFKTWYYSKSQGIEPTPPTPIYRDITTEETNCFGYDKYKVTTIKHLSGYSESELVVYDTDVVNTLIERNSPDCGYARPRIYSSYTVTDIMCEEDYTKLTINTTHYISGYSDVSPIIFEEYSSKTETVGREERSEYCGYVRPVGYSSYTETDFSCDGYTKLITAVTHYLSGYTDVTPIVYTEYSSKTEYSSEIESEDCGYLKGWNAKVILSDGTEQLFKYDDGIVPSGAFARRTDIVAAEFKNTITKLDVGVFQYCDKLTSVTLTDNITSIGTACFWACGKLKSITIPKGMTSIPQNCFTRCYGLTDIVIPNNITSIGKGAFTSCSNVTAITIQDSVTEIAANAFEGWKESGTLNCSDDWYDNLSETLVTNLGNVYNWRRKEPLEGCKIRITLNDGSKQVFEYDECILNDSFELRTDIVKLEIGDGITKIPDSVFNYCRNISSITIPNSVTSIGVCTFRCCQSLTSITIPNSITSIGDGCFMECSGITSIEIPNSVTSINSKTFAYCKSLTSVTIPNSVTSIGNMAFFDCPILSSVTIPRSVTSIGDDAFFAISETGTLYCYEDWYNTYKDKLGDLTSWTKVWL